MAYEYKCVGAPERARRVRGAKTRTDRVAHAMADLINTEAAGGWEYLRTDLLPVEEKAGLFSRAQEVHRAVLVFRRWTGPAQQAQPAAQAAPPVAPPVADPVPEPTLREAPDPVEDEPIRLAARKEDAPAERLEAPKLRAPSGLG